MSSKKIVVLGYIGACPIAGVIGLQRLGHDVHYVLKSLLDRVDV